MLRSCEGRAHASASRQPWWALLGLEGVLGNVGCGARRGRGVVGPARGAAEGGHSAAAASATTRSRRGGSGSRQTSHLQGVFGMGCRARVGVLCICERGQPQHDPSQLCGFFSRGALSTPGTTSKTAWRDTPVVPHDCLLGGWIVERCSPSCPRDRSQAPAMSRGFLSQANVIIRRFVGSALTGTFSHENIT